ncbi:MULTISPECIES: type II secretion system F family protein [Microbacterium]|uniref:type II secretion system F family protein n=1 Tax=Microbacterium TaxID=33882 RepID=UPI001E45DAF3|nr:type II secretion system F family protein [Microbacterium nymphoidis]MCD2496981.1 type II secretion system F family protein [Microbacterium nymphoidis]
MTALWAICFAAGVLCIASVWLWPRRAPHDAVESRPASAMRTLLAEAGASSLSPGALLIGAAMCALVAASAVWVLTRLPVLAALALLAGAVVPFSVLRARRARRHQDRRSVWPDVCDLLVASVRAGQSLPDGVAALADLAPQPVRAEFARFRSDLAASGHFDSAVLALKERLADPTADRIVETLRMARQVGGTELANVLRSLSTAVRAEAAVRGEVTARQSWIRGAAVVGVVAPWVILGLLVARPEGAAAYSTPMGVVLIAVAAGVSFVAYRLMLRIGRLPEQRRWFR